MVRSVQIPTISTRAAEVGAINEDARTVDLVWSTGADADRFDYASGRPYVERLSLKPGHVRLERLNAGASLLDTHSGYSLRNILGAVVPGTAKLEKAAAAAAAVCRVVFSKRAEVEPYYRDVVDKIIRFVSTGYKVHKFRDDGVDARGWPILTAIDWEPFEISMVPMPVDLGAQTRGAMPNGAEYFTVPVVPHEDSPAQERAHTMDPETTNTPAAPVPATPAPAAPVAAPVAETRAAVAPVAAAVTAHTVEITATAAEVRDLVRAAGGTDAQIVEILAQGPKPIAFVRGLVLDGLIARAAVAPTQSGIRMGDDARDKFIRGAVNWLIVKSGAEHLIRAAKLEGADGLNPGEFRGMTLLDLAREALERRGVQTRGLDKMSIAGQAFAHRDASITQSTGDFPILLENVMHKILQAAYSTVEDTWSKFCARGSVSDFRAHTRYRMGMFGALDSLSETGEFKNKPINDAEKATITAATKGNIINVSRQMVINDDMGAFVGLLSMLGRAAALSVEVDVYAALAANSNLGPTLGDGLSLFHASHNNIGTGAAFSVNSIDADRQVLASQKDPWGNEFLSLRPAVLLVPLSLGGQARITNQAQYDVDASNKFQVPNKVAGLYREVVDTPRITGTRRYSFADPSVAPVLEVAFLEGQSSPVLETKEGWRQDGTEMRVRFDYGVAGVDYRGAVTNAGV